MAQGIVLYKQVPDDNFVHDLQGKGVLRASMNFLPGFDYAAAGFFEASGLYDSAAPAESPPCPYQDLLSCLIWEIDQISGRLSNVPPLFFIVFVLLEVEFGFRQEWESHVSDVARDVGTADYIAAGHLVGSGPHNALVEVMSDDHDRLHRLVLRLTDHKGVKSIAVGRVAAPHTRGFGS